MRAAPFQLSLRQAVELQQGRWHGLRQRLAVPQGQHSCLRALDASSIA
jgi:hypothetical protein